MLVDAHICKMPTESAQMLSTAHRLYGCNHEKLYKDFNPKHPSSLWARESKANYLWLCMHYIALCDEYTFRYGKVHGAFLKLGNILAEIPERLPDIPFTAPPPAMPDKYKIAGNSLASYQRYYSLGKAHLHKWRKRQKPEWISNYTQETIHVED